MSVLDSRVPTRVQPAGVAVTDARALLLVTKSNRVSVSRTAAGMVTRCVIWFAASWADARNVMLSAAAAGVAVSPVTPSETAKLATTRPMTCLRPRSVDSPTLESGKYRQRSRTAAGGSIRSC